MKFFKISVCLKFVCFYFFYLVSYLYAQPWQQNDLIFNPSGIPSLAFSQPRFADVDSDGDFDLILGNISNKPLFFENIGSVSNPSFQTGPDIFAPVSSLDAEMGVFVDLDADNDLDFVCGGYTGLNYYENTGNSSQPVLNKIEFIFQGLAVGSNPIPTFADLDADEDPDLLIGISENGSLKFYPNTGTPDSAIYLESNSQTWYDVGLYAYPYFADLDNDGDFDLLIGKDIHGFSYYKNIGDSSTWQWQDQSSIFSGLGSATYWNSPCLVDLNNDNKKDLIFGTASGPLNYYRNTGSAANPTWTVNTNLFGGVLDVGGASSPCLIDFDYDGDFDLLSGSQLGDIKYYENTGNAAGPAWHASHSYFNSIDHSIYSAITAGDVDGDSLPDVVAGDLNGELFFHQNTGMGFTYVNTVFAGIDVGGFSAPKLIDMDNDSDLDLIVGNENGNLLFFENRGTPDSASWVEIANYFGNIDVGTNCVPAAGDVDGDGDVDIITGDLFREVQYFRNDNGLWIEDNSVVSGITSGQNVSPALGDLDGDGDLDLTLGNYEGTFNYFESKNETFLPGLNNKTNPTDIWLVKVYPNPFNLSTTFRINLPSKGNLSLEIYNLLGEKVHKKFISDNVTGHYHFRLNFPVYLSSGIYYYILKFENVNFSKLMNGKIIYLK